MDNFSTLGKQAISDAQPAGAEVRDEPDFELLQDEIAKMSNPVTSGSLDWNQVARLAAALLAGKGKDVLVSCYLAGALLQTRGLPGLRDGLQVLDDMLATYWDTLFPPLQRMRGRRNAVVWLLERIKAHGDETDWSSLPPQDPDLIAGLRGALQSIDALLVDKDGDAPSLRPALSQLNTVPVQEPEPEPLAQAASVTGSSAGASASATAGGPGGSAGSAAAAATPLDCAENVELACGETLERLGEIADWLSEAQPANPLAYRLKRIAAWAGIEALPPQRDGQSLLAAPIRQLQDVLGNLVASQSHADLLQFTQAQLGNFPFWLDLNCIAAQAMSRLGAGYDAARLEVCGETARLIGRIDGLEEMKFSGGMPCASVETRQWLHTLQAAGDGSSGAGGGVAAPADEARQDALLQARALAAQDDLAGASACLQAAIERSRSPGERLQLRIDLCELLFDERPGAQLDAFAHAVCAEIDRYDLASWSPALALAGLQAAYNILARNDDNRSTAQALLARIVALDASAAVRLVT